MDFPLTKSLMEYIRSLYPGSPTDIESEGPNQICTIEQLKKELSKFDKYELKRTPNGEVFAYIDSKREYEIIFLIRGDGKHLCRVKKLSERDSSSS